MYKERECAENAVLKCLNPQLNMLVYLLVTEVAVAFFVPDNAA